jgi:non-heme chloroperoxidase
VTTTTFAAVSRKGMRKMQAVSCIVTSSDGCRLYAQAVGKRDHLAILFIHGIGVSSAWWRKQFDYLSDHFYCVSFDLRGHGASDKPSDPAAYQESHRWADDVMTVMDAFELIKPIVCVWSYGGYVLADYLRHYGGKNISALVLVDTEPQLGTEEAIKVTQPGCLERVGRMLSASDITTYRDSAEDILKMMTLEPIEQPDYADLLGAAFLVAPSTWQAMFSRQVDNSDLFQAISLPTLILYGQHDGVLLPAAGEQFLELIPHAQVSVYPGGHAPFYESAERFNFDLIQFINKPF